MKNPNKEQNNLILPKIVAPPTGALQPKTPEGIALQMCGTTKKLELANLSNQRILEDISICLCHSDADIIE